MDLFDPPINFDYKTMPDNIVYTQDFENPYIQVVWEDSSENFTQERIKSVKHYFQKKYNSLNVNVITKSKQSEDVNQTIDVSFNIMDKNYQRELMKGFLESKGLGDHFDEIVKIDEIVDNKLLLKTPRSIHFRDGILKRFISLTSYHMETIRSWILISVAVLRLLSRTHPTLGVRLF